jgi:polysaccharide export outer membrane protein
MRAVLRSAFAVLLLCLAVPIQSAQAQGERDYRIGPKDQLRISVFEVPELGGELRVSEQGTINLAPVGEIDVQGKTRSELELHLKAVLEERFFQRATVSVQVLEFRSKPISVIGAVNQPGNLAFSGRWTLLEAITAAGGLAANHGDTIFVMRRADNGLTDQVKVPVEALLVRPDPNYNLPIFANDLINVPPAITVNVYCLGEVSSPGALTFKSTERISLLAAIARAGGMTDRASSKITVKRNDTDPKKAEEFQLDYKRILAGKSPDFPLQDGDVVVVKESFF